MEYGARVSVEHRLVWIGIFGVIVMLVAFVAYSFWPTAMTATAVTLGAKTFHAEMIDVGQQPGANIAEYRAVLEGNQALLYAYPKSDSWIVQAQDLHSAVDILWITDSKKVAYVAKNAQPSNSHIYRPGGTARYVLYLPAGSAAKYSIKTGQSITFNDKGNR